MKFNVYSVKDTVQEVSAFRGTFLGSNDADLIRTSLFSILMDFNARDIEIYQIGNFDDDTGELTPCKLRKVSLDAYIFPKSRVSPPGEDMTLEEVEKTSKDFKAKRMADLAQQVENERGTPLSNVKKEVVNE